MSRPLWESRFITSLEPTSFNFVLVVHVMPWVLSAVLGAVLQDRLGDMANGKFDGASLPMIICCACLIAMLCLFAMILKLIAETRKSKAYNVTTWRDRPDIQGKQTAFDFCSAVAKNARESIVVVGPHFTEASSDVGTASHDDYLATSMAAAVERHVKTPPEAKSAGLPFEYYRVIPMDPGRKDHISKEGEADFDMFGNKALASHVGDLIDANIDQETLNVRFVTRDFVPSLPSILVVDNRYVFFSLPTYASSQVPTRGNSRKKRELRYDYVLGIEDATGKIPTEFANLIRSLDHEGRQIKSVRQPRSKAAEDPKPSTDAGKR